jgi:hypothetical protein
MNTKKSIEFTISGSDGDELDVTTVVNEDSITGEETFRLVLTSNKEFGCAYHLPPFPTVVQALQNALEYTKEKGW